MQHHLTYREHAAQARAAAEATSLENVRERHLRSETAFLAMAERLERIDRARAVRKEGEHSQNQSQETS